MMLDPDINRSMDTNLDERTQTLLTDTWRSIEAGMPALEAAQAAIQTAEMWGQNKEVMNARQNYFTAENYGNEELDSGFEDMVDDLYDAYSFLHFDVSRRGLPYLGEGATGQGEFTIEGLGRDAEARYHKYGYDAFMRSNNLETAKMQATLMFRQLHSFNNLNGPWAIELNGVKGDVHAIQTDWIQEYKDEQVLFTGDKGLTGSTIGALDDVKFLNPIIVPEGKKYEVWTGSVPVMKYVETTVEGKKVVNKEQVYKTVTNKTMDSRELQDIRKQTNDEIAELQKEYDKAVEHLGTSNIYGRGGSRGSVRNVPKKIKRKREDLRKEEERLLPKMELR
jgi:hypothetical protein